MHLCTCAGENACETRTAREGPNDPESTHWGSQSACLNLLQLKEICYHLCNGITKFKVCKFIPTNIILSPSPPLWRRCGALEVAQRKDAKSGDRTPRWGRCLKNKYYIEKNMVWRQTYFCRNLDCSNMKQSEKNTLGKFLQMINICFLLGFFGEEDW